MSIVAARRFLALLISGSLAFGGVVALTINPAAAVTVAPMARVYDSTVNGDYLLVGNGSLACDQSKQFLTGGVPNCADYHGGIPTTGGKSNVNDYQWMKNADTDSDPTTFNSTSASVAIPAGAKVIKAVLYWSGNTGVVKGQTGVRCGSTGLGTAPGHVVPGGTPAGQKVRFVMAGVSSDLAAATYASESDGQLANNAAQYYSASADVTSKFSSPSTGAPTTVTVGNVWAPQGYACYGGWSLALVYDFGAYDPANPLTAAREVILYQGHVRKQADDTSPETVRFDGFTVQGSGVHGGYTLYEGDRGIVGDTATYATSSSPTQTQLRNAFGETGNIGTSNADASTPFAGYTAPTFTNGSADARSVQLPNAAVGDTSITMALDTTGDSYLLQNTILSVPAASIRIDKSVDGVADSQTVLAGNSPTFTITVTNAGSTALHNVTVTDAQAPGCARSLGTIPPPPAPGSRVTYTCTGIPATTAFTNTATVSAKTPLEADVDRTDTSRVEVSSITVVKVASSASVPAGTPVTWTIEITNTGSTTLSGVSVSDVLVPSCSRTDLGTLAAGASTTFTCSGIVGSGFTNSVSTTGVDPIGHTARDTDVAPIAVSGITVTKTSDVEFAVPGQDVVFTFTVTNTGEVTLSGVTVTDPDFPTCSRTIPDSLTPDASVTFTCTVNAAAADFTNHVTATGKPTDGGPSPSDDDAATVDVRTPNITIDKSTSTPIVTDGGTATFEITVQNTGQTVLTGVVVGDAIAPSCARTIGTLTPGQVVTFSCTLAELHKAVTNTATVTGTSPGGTKVTADDSATVTVARVTIEKTTATPVVPIGAPVTFTITVTNAGDTDLATVEVSDPLLAACARSDLGPLTAGASVTYTCTDPSVGRAYTNVATVVGTPVGGPSVTDADSARVGTSGITVEKSASSPNVVAGTSGSYVIVVTNTGSTVLTDVVVADPAAPDCDRTIATLDPGTASAVTFTCDSPVLDHGQTNTVTVSGTPPSGPVATDTDDATIATSDIAVVKSPNVDNVAPGATVTFTITVINTGEVPLTDVRVDDPRYPMCSRTDLGTLAVNARTSYTCTVVAGSTDLTNTAIATGTPPDAGDKPTGEGSATVDVDSPGISIRKSTDTPVITAGTDVTFTIEVMNTGDVDLTDVVVTDPLSASCDRTVELLTAGDSTSYECIVPNVAAGFTNTAAVTATPAGGGTAVTDDDSALVQVAGIAIDKETSTPIVGPGDTAAFRITVTNTGEVPLTDVNLTDPAVASCASDIGTLQPHASVVITCAGTDVTKGFTNTATVDGAAGELDVSATDDATVAVSSISLSKKVSDPVAPIGSTVTFTITVVNNGEVPLTDVKIADPSVPDCSATIGTLEPGASKQVSCTAVVPPGGLANVAVATGEPPSGPKPTSTDDTDTKASGIRIDKVADVDAAAPGAPVTYTITVTNTGQVVLTQVEVTDEIAPGCARTGADDLGSLEPGESTTYTCTATMGTGDVVNVATATGTPPGGDQPTDEGTATTDVLAPAVSIVKAATPPVVAVGTDATFTITVTNVGDVALTDVEVDDPLAPGCSRSVGDLVIGASVTYTCSVAGVVAGFTNVASVTAVPAGGGTPVGDRSSARVDVAAMTLVKDTGTPIVAVGDTASFRVVVTNTGGVVLADLRVSDPLAPGCDTTIARLEPGAQKSIECSVPNVDAGFTNRASVTATPPVGPDLLAADDATVAVAAVTIVKDAVAESVPEGDPTTFRITVTNRGEVELAPVEVVDPLTPACSQTLESLAPGESVTYTCVLPETLATFVNVATASGVADGVVVTGEDDALAIAARVGGVVENPPGGPGDPTDPEDPAAPEDPAEPDDPAEPPYSGGGPGTPLPDTGSGGLVSMTTFAFVSILLGVALTRSRRRRG